MEKYFRLTVELHDEETPNYDIKLVREIPNTEIDYEEIIDMIKFMMVGLTFSEKQFDDMLVEYIERKDELINRIVGDRE